MGAKFLKPFDRLITQRGTAATIQDQSESNLYDTHILITNTKYVQMLGTNRADLIIAYFASKDSPQPGQIVVPVGMPVPRYIIVKRLHVTPDALFNPGVDVSMIALPETVTFVRPASTLQYANRNPYDEPQGEVNGYPDVAVQSLTLHCGFSNSYDPAMEGAEGLVPAGAFTLFAPLGATVDYKDEATIDGQTWFVSQNNLLFSTGTPYARQYILNKGGGENLTPQ